MNAALLVLLLAVGAGWAESASDACCKCPGRAASLQTDDVVCLSAREIRAHVVHIEPLQPSGLGKGLKLAGTVVVDIRFGSDGKVACARARSGHPIAISAAMEAVPKWTFKPVTVNGVAKSGCGRITIKYRLRDRGSTTELVGYRGQAARGGFLHQVAAGGYRYDGIADLRS